VIFEYRSSEVSGPAQDRAEYRLGYFLFHDTLWERINLRNDRQSYQDGFFRLDIPTFDEAVVREAVLNAVCHRDYRLPGSVFVRQYARRLEVTSPGGLPEGVTVENILDQQVPRNRRLAEACARCGLVERSGQGMNLIFERSIQHSKPLPGFDKTSEHQVWLTLHGTVGNPAFVRFLARVGRESVATFTTHDFLVLDLIHREERIHEALKPRLPGLVDRGVIERVGQGRGSRYMLSRQFYTFVGRKGVYTRKRGLDRETNKTLLLRHIQGNAKEGCPLHEMAEVLPALSRPQIQALLRDLRAEGRIHSVGHTRAARWYPGSDRKEIASDIA
jgi:ATP-dependent DNA helicase RecG